jgi:hypothetical protein
VHVALHVAQPHLLGQVHRALHVLIRCTRRGGCSSHNHNLAGGAPQCASARNTLFCRRV